MPKEGNLMEIVESQEFKEFTRLIKQNTYNQIVYGDHSTTKWDLINKLKESRESKEKLLEVISDLSADHSMEKAEKESKEGTSYLTPIKFDSTKKIIEWIETYGAKTLANLILAFGLTWTEEELDRLEDNEEENEDSTEEE